MSQILVLVSLLLLLSCMPCSGQKVRNQTTDEYTRACETDLDSEEVLHRYETKNFGCLVICSILSPSSKKYSEFLNHFALKKHYLSGRQCINETYVSPHIFCRSIILITFSN